MYGRSRWYRQVVRHARKLFHKPTANPTRADALILDSHFVFFTNSAFRKSL